MRSVPFCTVAPRTSFYPGVNGAGHYGKCVKLAYPIRVGRADPALPFVATAVSEQGILLHIDEGDMVSFSPPLQQAQTKVVADDETSVTRDPVRIPIAAGYYFTEGSRKGPPITAYVRTTGQFVTAGQLI